MWREENIYFFQPKEPVFDSNTVLIDGKDPVIVDPGTESRRYFQDILEATGNSFEDIEMVFFTHGHYDHFEGVSFFPEAKKIAFHPDSERIENKTGFEVLGLNEERDLEIGGSVFKVIHTPGHSEGSCSLYLEGKILVSGDLVFANGSFGRTDLDGGSKEDLKRSLEKVNKLDFKYLLPGHRDIGDMKSVEKALENFK